MNPKVDFYFQKEGQWQDAIALLRQAVLSTGLEEVLKWGCPCYTDAQKNVVLIHVFKEYCALLFFKGALMDDADGLLIQQTENVQGARQMRFISTAEVKKKLPAIKRYVKSAIAVERSGKKVELKQKSELVFPEELQKLFDEDANFKAAFAALTPGRQRAYNLYFSAPKQSKTRAARIEKYLPQILDGKGIND